MLKSLMQVKRPRMRTGPNPNFNGIWVNELGSKMTLRVHPGGNLRGSYATAVGSPPDEEEFDLWGFVSGDMISFTVNFGKYGSLTSWVGQHTETSDGAMIKTMWLLARNIEDPEEPDGLWGAILSGYNNFTR